MEKLADFLYDLPKDYGLFFDAVHYVVCVQAERADIGNDFDRISKANPLVSPRSVEKDCLLGCRVMSFTS